MVIITLADVKPKLQIPTSDTSEDSAIQSVIDSVCQFVYDETGLDPVATAHTDIREKCQIGREYELDHRPVDISVNGQGALVNAITAQGRTLAAVPVSATGGWTTLAVDVIDDTKGRVILLGSDLSAFPPIVPNDVIYSWRGPIWPIVRFTYKTVGQDGAWPADLKDQTAHFASFMYKHEFSSHLVSASLGGIHEMYHGSKGGMADIIPPTIRSAIARYAIKRTFLVA